jgi:AcrR family transcriptional regulator
MFPLRSKEEVVQEFRIQSIQEATLRVIARKGMTGATVQEIADEAGVAKGTIYLYFRDRDELIEKTFEAAVAQFIARIDAVIAEDVPFDRKIRAIIAAKIGFFGENREFFRLYMAQRMPEGPSPTARRKHQECRPEYRERVQKFANVLKEAMERGEIRELDAYRLALFIMEGTTSVVLERLTEESSPSEAADVDFLTALVLDGIRKRS